MSPDKDRRSVLQMSQISIQPNELLSGIISSYYRAYQRFTVSPIQPRPSGTPTADYGYGTKAEEVDHSRWINEPGTGVQSAWGYFANLDTSDGDSMRRLAKYFHYRLNKINGRNDSAMYALDLTEMMEMNRMFEESVGNELLTEMLTWFTTFRDGPERQLLNRAQELARMVNNFVRNPTVYPVDYSKEKALWEKKNKSSGTARTRGAATEEVETGEGASPSPTVQTNGRKFSAKTNGKKRKVPSTVTSAQPDIPIRTVQPRMFEKPKEDEDDDEEEDEEDPEEEDREPLEKDHSDEQTYKFDEPAKPGKRRRLVSRAVLAALKNGNMNGKMDQLKDDDKDYGSFKSSSSRSTSVKWDEDPKKESKGASKTAPDSKGKGKKEDKDVETDSSEDDMPYKNVFEEIYITDTRKTRSGKEFNPYAI
ncbi:hypothetical protein GLAREA_05325 [Glarea lozoyensis ATCC 20868]|uniref:Uncharacterized protein n=1 Tax=Glarea lozoyensis (strain ATCC 20868 / MF5171) TaxID=1116229 RepID=S3DC32_GLAL2|nr:uncharacterized protein GLAREA_05325 [Glarea lozoyensis ATCC 20868]EPE35987.1 hypothetical protein GLAREA_05325 [Glarea lozoyensis ATCC 20868]